MLCCPLYLFQVSTDQQDSSTDTFLDCFCSRLYAILCCVQCGGAFLGKTQNSRLMNSYSLHFSFACHVTVYGENVHIILLQLKAFRSTFFLFFFCCSSGVFIFVLDTSNHLFYLSEMFVIIMVHSAVCASLDWLTGFHFFMSL